MEHGFSCHTSLGNDYLIQYLNRTVVNKQEHLLCDLCLNPLDEPELEYADSTSDYKWQKFDLGVYFEVNCKHKFHPN